LFTVSTTVICPVVTAAFVQRSTAMYMCMYMRDTERVRDQLFMKDIKKNY